ncbi:MAG TPA: glutaredoxin family protein [Porticoccaceae bacterium]|nr:glutaredoxin family protein [Porticoccaceae bacterium]HIK80338.1 glutaredoxin family protein [Porticoccaceae bacterium]
MKSSEQLHRSVIIYSGPNCHLCDEAKSILEPVLSKRGWHLIVVDIQDNASLKEKYGLRIPVVLLPDGREKGWPFTAAQIAKMLTS